MDLNEELAKYIDALRVTNATALFDILQRSQSALEKLEQDRKVLRWALFQAREAMIGGTTNLNRDVVMSIIDTAHNMTEAANDR